jgi:hypothetical protein
MAVYEKMVEKYSIFADSPVEPGSNIAWILLQGQGFSVRLFFKRNGETLSSVNAEEDGSYFQGYYYSDQFQIICDMLRYEKPVYFYHNTESNFIRLKTTLEPVGEEETV